MRNTGSNIKISIKIFVIKVLVFIANHILKHMLYRSLNFIEIKVKFVYLQNSGIHLRLLKKNVPFKDNVTL